ncbi:COPII-coated vesicle component Sfb3 [Schizosaccharomyces pombe]
MAYPGQFGNYGNPETYRQNVAGNIASYGGPEIDTQLAAQMNAQMYIQQGSAMAPQPRRARRHKDAHAYDMSLTDAEPALAPVMSPAIPPSMNYPTPSTPSVLPESFSNDTNLLDPAALPSAPEVRYEDQQLFKNQIFNTMEKGSPPMSTTDFVGYEQGNSSSKFVQFTSYAIPATNDVCNASGIPLGMIVQPFAELRPDEAPVPVVDYTNSNPPRCKKCRGYINPFIQFTMASSKWTCNLCGSENSFNDDGFNPLVGSQHDGVESRPELNVGTIDFKVGKDYWIKEDPPKPARFVFMIDVSYEASSKGLPKVAAEAIRNILYGPVPLDPNVKIAIVCFDRSVNFFNLSPNLEQPHMLAASDLENPFVPFSSGLFVDPIASKVVIERLLDSFPAIFQDVKIPEPVVGNALEVVKLLLKETGGKAFVFVSALPTMGLGKLRHREDQRLYGTSDEKNLWNTQDKWYTSLADEYVTAGIGVDIFFTATAYVDVATVGSVATLSGGQIYHYSNFVADRDGSRLKQDLFRSVTREQGYRVMLKTRCSNGLRVSKYLGNFLQRTPQDIEFGSLDADKSVTVLFSYDGKLNGALDAHFQTAVLYTTPSGERRVRVVNYCCAVTSKSYDTISLAIVEPIVAVLAKIASTNIAAGSLKDTSVRLVEGVVKILSSYRKVAANRLTPGQLVLPKNLVLLPILILAVLKSSAIRSGSIHSDIRVSQLREVRAAPIQELMLNLYPNIYALHQLQPTDCLPDPENTGCLPINMPLCVRASRKFIEDGGAFLIVTGQKSYLWFHQRTSPLLLQDLLGVESLEDIDSLKALELPTLDTVLSVQVRNLLSSLRMQFPSMALHPQIVRQGLDGSEGEIFSTLVEDNTREGFGYLDFLTKIHESLHTQGYK